MSSSLELPSDPLPISLNKRDINIVLEFDENQWKDWIWERTHGWDTKTSLPIINDPYPEEVVRQAYDYLVVEGVHDKKESFFEGLKKSLNKAINESEIQLESDVSDRKRQRELCALERHFHIINYLQDEELPEFKRYGLQQVCEKCYNSIYLPIFDKKVNNSLRKVIIEVLCRVDSRIISGDILRKELERIETSLLAFIYLLKKDTVTSIKDYFPLFVGTSLAANKNFLVEQGLKHLKKCYLENLPIILSEQLSISLGKIQEKSHEHYEIVNQIVKKGGLSLTLSESTKDLAGKPLVAANLEGNKLSEIDLSRANLSSANLSNAQLTSAVNLRDASLINADLSNVKQQDGNLSGANLENANLSGADLRGFNFANANLKGAILSNANLSGANFKNADLSRANLIGANLIQAILQNAKLIDAKLDSAILTCANLKYADLSHATVKNVDAINTKLRNANLQETDLRGSVFTNADFSNANLSNTLLTNAVLRWVDFTLTNLTESILVGVDLSGSSFRNANLSCKRAYDIKFDDRTTFGNCIVNDMIKNQFTQEVDLSKEVDNIDIGDLQVGDKREQYLKLAVLNGFNEQQEKSLKTILEEAKNNYELDKQIEEANELIQHRRKKSRQNDYDDIVSRFSISDFLHQIEKVNPDDINSEKFKEWIGKLQLTEEFLSSYINLLQDKRKEKEYEDKKIPIQIICQTNHCSIGVMLWQPGVSSGRHPHGNILNIIRVHKGTLLNTKYLDENDEGGRGETFKEGQEVFIDRHEWHDMKNINEQEDLITVHFRFGELISREEVEKQPNPENRPALDDNQPIISGNSILILERALEFSATFK